MILLFRDGATVYAVEAERMLPQGDIDKLVWLFSGAQFLGEGAAVVAGAENGTASACEPTPSRAPSSLLEWPRREGGRPKANSARREARSPQPAEAAGAFVGPRREMVTPWSTNAVEIAQNMGIGGIRRIEQFFGEGAAFDAMLHRRYNVIGQDVFAIETKPEPIKYIADIAAYNRSEGLALSADEIAYLDGVAQKMGRSLTDSEVFGFSQVNSEHCRHKIFGGEFVIDGKARGESLFTLIKRTTAVNRGRVVSAYKDNCAFLAGPVAEQFAPRRHDRPDFFEISDFESVITIKAETHNFPTTVEPFNGAATGTGGEIRDRIAGGKGAFPIAGTAVYMTSYPRLDVGGGVGEAGGRIREQSGGRPWERAIAPRKWLYQTPEQILIKASNGASDFGNKFGQPLVCGSLVTFEHEENGRTLGFDKVIMMAGGIGYGRKQDSLKDEPQKGDSVVLLGGDNYRIGMGGGAVSSVATGEYANAIELNAVQRSNPEMQKRVYNAIRALGEEERNPVVSIHDHGAGGHLNCLSELVEATGGRIDLDKLPVGDPTLSDREIIGNESQERMGLVMSRENTDHLRRIAERERAPMYLIGEAIGDMRFTFVDNRTGEKPIDWPLEYMFGNPPRTVLNDSHLEQKYKAPEYGGQIVKYIEDVLQLEGVACKDWLTNKVDRSVTGRIAMQQCAGVVQLPLNDCAVVALDYQGRAGIATALGDAPVAALVDAARGSVLAIAESLTNIVFAPLAHGLKGVSLSANWMWPCKNPGEDARLYDAVQAASDFAIALGINIPTGKDSLSMTQKYPDGELVYAPGTVIITSAGEVSDVRGAVPAALSGTQGDIIYVDFSRCPFDLGGSSFSQSLGAIGGAVPTVGDAGYFARAFESVQQLIIENKVLAGHDISKGGLVTALLEMAFADNHSGMEVRLDALGESDMARVLMSEKPAVVLQVADGAAAEKLLRRQGVEAHVIGTVNGERRFTIENHGVELPLQVDHLRDMWFRTSYLLDRAQSGAQKAVERYNNYKEQELRYKFPASFTGTYAQYNIDPHRKGRTGVRAAIIREKGVNGDREMAWAMHLAGMDVKDVHMTDLVSGRETLEDVNMIVFVGGFSNSDVLGSAKGWAGAFLYNPGAREALERFFAREDTLSLGVCNGCQLMIELGLITPLDERKPRMLHNDSRKFESGFVGVDILPTNSVMLGTLAGSSLGIWIAHGEGKFSLPLPEEHYNIALKYSYVAYPGNPNGSDFATAGIVSADGRHLAMMPHLERSIKPWNWPYYPTERRGDEVTPWIEAFVNARKWIEEKLKRSDHE